jgi:hypothetical protein
LRRQQPGSCPGLGYNNKAVGPFLD